MQQERDSQPFSFPPSTFPSKHVVGAIDKLSDAEQAMTALRNAGYTAEQIYLFTGEQFLQGIQENMKLDNFVVRALREWETRTDEGSAREIYMEEARQGHYVLAVSAPTSEEAEQISKILIGSHAHVVKYYDTWKVINFPS